MTSLERQLQVNLALTLAGVMALIWMIGSQLPRSLPDLQTLQMQGYTCTLTGLTGETAGKLQTAQENGLAYRATTADATGSLLPVTHRQHRFKWLFPFLATGGIVLTLVVQGAVIRRTFRRLDHIRTELLALEGGLIGQLNEAVPAEIHPIVTEFNRLLSLMQERLERSRQALGNLAHALKGPLNLLVQYLDQQPDTPDSHQARQQAERLRQLTERELKRARLAGQGNSTRRFDPRVELPVLVDVLKRLHHTQACEIRYHIDPAITRFADREDMLELVGNLLDNACKWATQRVRCDIHLQGNRVQIIIADDGTGCTPETLQQIAGRGVRLDESVEGYGLGLAICQDIVKLYGGTLTFTQSPTLGGLQVNVLL